MTKLYLRIEAVDEEEFEDDLVVMNADTQAVVTLNGTARIVWEAVAEPISFDDIAALFDEAFPGADPQAVRRDIAGVLAELDRVALVIVSDT